MSPFFMDSTYADSALFISSKIFPLETGGGSYELAAELPGTGSAPKVCFLKRDLIFFVMYLGLSAA